MAKNTSNILRRRLSPAGRAACAASGCVNLQRWKDSQPEVVDLRAAIDRFEAGIIGDLGHDPREVERGLALSAAISYGAIILASSKLLAKKLSRRQVEGLLDAITRQQGQLIRTLASLGVIAHAPDERDSQAGGRLGPLEWMKGRGDAETGKNGEA